MRRPELTQGLVRVDLALPALIATAIFIAFGALEGGYPPSVWYPAALFVLGLLFVTLVSLPPSRRAPRPLLAASGLLTAYAAWSYLSITWADQRGDAWDGANRTLLYAIVFALFALWPLRAHGATLVLAGLGLGIATLGCVELVRASAAEAPAAYFTTRASANRSAIRTPTWRCGARGSGPASSSPRAESCHRSCAGCSWVAPVS